jgi:hypothetical protein
VHDCPGPTGGELFEVTFVSEATSLEIAAIDLIRILSDLLKDGQIFGVCHSCHDPDVDVKVWHVVEVLDILQVEHILVLN